MLWNLTPSEKLQKSLRKHKQVSSDEVGLFISPEYPYLGASPDLILNCKFCGKYVVEIKCPESIKTTTPSSQNLNYLVSNGGITKLNILLI